MVENSFSVSVFCICGAIFAVLLRRYCREQSLLAAVAACTVLLGAFISMVSPVIQDIQELFIEAGISDSYISLILKAAAVCFITQITCELCRDSGEGAIAAGAELWGRGAITVMALPVVKALLEMLSDYL